MDKSNVRPESEGIAEFLGSQAPNEGDQEDINPDSGADAVPDSTREEGVPDRDPKDQPGTGADVEDDRTDTGDEDDHESAIDAFRREMNELARNAFQSSQQPESSEDLDRSDEIGEQVSEKSGKGEDIQFITEEEFEEAIGSAASFNRILNRVFQSGREAAIRDARRVASQTANREVSYANTVQRFYEENEDLTPFRDYVAVVARKVQAENPDMDLQALLNETASRARKTLKMTERAEGIEERRKKTGGKGSFAPAGGGRRRPAKDTRSEQQKQIDDLLPV